MEEYDTDTVLATIREYENSVDMPEEERFTYVDDEKHIHLKEGDDKALLWRYQNYAEHCKEYLRFGDEVDLATCGGMNPLDQLKVCDTPTILRGIGFEQKPMLYTQRHLAEAIHPKSEENYHWHGLTIEQVKRLPSLLEHPVLLADSPARQDAMLAVLTEVDCDKLPLIVAIKSDGKGNYVLQEIETNFILSVYGKNEFEKYFSERITPDKVIYYNEKQGQKLETLAELQLFRCHPVADGLENTIIRHPQCIVNGKSAGEEGYDLSSEAKAVKSASEELASASVEEQALSDVHLDEEK